jgi:hypothetical protein
MGVTFADESSRVHWLVPTATEKPPGSLEVSCTLVHIRVRWPDAVSAGSSPQAAERQKRLALYRRFSNFPATMPAAMNTAIDTSGCAHTNSVACWSRRCAASPPC